LDVKAASWRFETAEFVRHNVTFSRSLLQVGAWKENQSFGRADLPRLMKCAE